MALHGRALPDVVVRRVEVLVPTVPAVVLGSHPGPPSEPAGIEVVRRRSGGGDGAGRRPTTGCGSMWTCRPAIPSGPTTWGCRSAGWSALAEALGDGVVHDGPFAPGRWGRTVLLRRPGPGEVFVDGRQGRRPRSAPHPRRRVPVRRPQPLGPRTPDRRGRAACRPGVRRATWPGRPGRATGWFARPLPRGARPALDLSGPGQARHPTTVLLDRPVAPAGRRGPLVDLTWRSGENWWSKFGAEMVDFGALVADSGEAPLPGGHGVGGPMKHSTTTRGTSPCSSATRSASSMTKDASSCRRASRPARRPRLHHRHRRLPRHLHQ